MTLAQKKSAPNSSVLQHRRQSSPAGNVHLRPEGASPFGARSSTAPRACACGGSCPRCLPPSDVERTLSRPGVAIDTPLRSSMERHFKADFSAVRIHRDTSSAKSADLLGASAYSYGSQIVLGSRYNNLPPSEKEQLLAHELNHVIESPNTDKSESLLQVDTDSSAESRANHAAERYSQQQPNQAIHTTVAGRIRLQPAATPKAAVKYPAVIVVGTERVQVATAAEDKEARQLIADIQSNHGITLDSDKGKATVRSKVKGDPYQPQTMTDALQNKPPEKVKDLITTSIWTLQQLRDLKKGLELFRPVLGTTNRSIMGLGAQPITSFSRVSTGLNDANTAADPDVLGQCFSSDNHIALFDSAPSLSRLADPKNAFYGVVVHELGHGLLPPDLFLSGLSPAYWKDVTTPTNDPKAEAPISNYGGKNAREDMAEAVMFYFVEQATLKSKCPQRFALVEGAVKKLFTSSLPQGPKP